MISVSKPAACACLVSVAMMSSASYPSTSNVLMRSAARTSWISSTWPRNGSGELERFALYSGKRSVRKVWRDTSNATAMCVGASSRRVLMSIEVKP